MLTEFYLLKQVADDHLNELRHEAEADRLARLARPRGRFLRGALANGLNELARWIDGRPPAPRPAELQPAR